MHVGFACDEFCCFILQPLLFLCKVQEVSPKLSRDMTLDHRDDREWLAHQMLQTNGQAFREDMERLQEILREQPAWVRDTVNRFLQEEEARTFQNVVGQIELFIDMFRQIAELGNCEDAAALSHLIKDVHPSNMRGLQREAKSIGEAMEELRLCIGNKDWETMSGLVQRIKNKVRRFRDKFADLRPKLERLAKKLAELATECEENASRAEGLKHEVEARRDWWYRLLGNFALFIGISSGVGLLGGGIAAVVLHVFLHQEYVALTAAMGTAAQASKAATAAAITLKAAGAKAATAAKAAAGKALAAHSAAATATGVAALSGPASIASAALMLTGPLGLIFGTAAAVGTLCGAVVSQCSAASAATAASTAAAAATAPASKASAAATAAQAAAATAATANAQVTSLQTVIASISGWAASCTPFIASTALLLALFMLGWLGRDLLKSLLGRLWAAEIKAHEYCAAEWRRLEQDLKTAAKQLRESTASCEELETCLDAMFEAAENASEILEDHNTYPCEGDLEGLVREVDELCSSFESAISAFEHVQGQVMSLHNHASNNKYLVLLSDVRRPLTYHSNLPIEDNRAPSISSLSMLENAQADGSGEGDRAPSISALSMLETVQADGSGEGDRAPSISALSMLETVQADGSGEGDRAPSISALSMLETVQADGSGEGDRAPSISALSMLETVQADGSGEGDRAPSISALSMLETVQADGSGEGDRAPSISALSMLETVQTDGSSVSSMHELQLEPRVEEVTLGPPVPVEPASIPSLADEGWILMESEPCGRSW